MVFDTVVNTFEMKFENEGFKEMIAAKEARKDASMPIRAATLFEMFPFCLLFNVSISPSRYNNTSVIFGTSRNLRQISYSAQRHY